MPRFSAPIAYGGGPVRRLIFAFAIFLLTAVLPPRGLADEGACEETGSLSRETYHSAVDAVERHFTVYLPPCYQTGADAYPALLLLHGSNATDSQWSRLGFISALESRIHAGTAPPLIVLMPYGGLLANENRFDDWGYATVLRDFLAQMGRRYRLNGAQAVGGISRGGFWAYQLGMRFPNEFVAIGGHSPFFDREHVEAVHNPLELAESLNAETHLKLWLDRGVEDYAALGVEQMHTVLKRERVPHQYTVYPEGQHREASWRLFVDDYVDFYAGTFSSPEATAPAQAAADEFELWLPAASFGALLTSIDSTTLTAVLAAELDERLVLSEANAQRLEEQGFAFHEDTNIVVDDLRLFWALWREKGSYTLLPFDALHLRLRPLWLDDVPVVDQLERYPLVFRSDKPNFSPAKLTRITLSGTTALARHTQPALDAIGVERAASGIQDYVRLADFFHITNEASISANCPQSDAPRLAIYNSMCMKREHLPLFDLLEVDVVDLTGNHINDYGYEALLTTMQAFEARGFALVGGGPTREAARQPLILEHNGSRIGWLACNSIGPPYAFASDEPIPPYGSRPGAAFCHQGWLQEALPVLAAQVDLLLLTLQYREFEGFLPLERHLNDYRRFAEWGADIVIGTAEHKPMTFEFYPTARGETAFIHYGLGNLFFDQLGWGNRRFFMDTLYIYAGQLLTVELFPGIIDERARPRLLTGAEQFNFLHFMFIQKNQF